MQNDNGGFGVFFLIIFAFLLWNWATNCKLRYAWQYGIDSSQITVEAKPTDCDFMHSPLGDKDCHYTKEVSIIKRGMDTKSSRPIISFDNGKSWSWDDGDQSLRGTLVRVYWVRATR
jgi:hypothetical protein